MAGAGRGTEQKTSTLRSFATAASFLSLPLSLFSMFCSSTATRPLIVELHNGCIIFSLRFKVSSSRRGSYE